MQTRQIVRSIDGGRFVSHAEISPLRENWIPPRSNTSDRRSLIITIVIGLITVIVARIAVSENVTLTDASSDRSCYVTIEPRYLYTYYRALSSQSISYFRGGASDAACLGAVAGNNEICLPDFYPPAAAYLPPTSSITVALLPPGRRLANRIRIFFLFRANTLRHHRRVFARYVNGTSSDERCNKRRLDVSSETIFFFWSCPERGIVIGH